MTDGNAGRDIFQVRHLQVDTLSERVLFIHEDAVRAGNLGVRPLDRVQVIGLHPETGEPGLIAKQLSPKGRSK